MVPADEDPVSHPIFRVSFSGTAVESATLSAALDAVDRCWEGGNRALVGADCDDEAIRIVREV
jgi:hypothetical protein